MSPGLPSLATSASSVADAFSCVEARRRSFWRRRQGWSERGRESVDYMRGVRACVPACRVQAPRRPKPQSLASPRLPNRHRRCSWQTLHSEPHPRVETSRNVGVLHQRENERREKEGRTAMLPFRSALTSPKAVEPRRSVSRPAGRRTAAEGRDGRLASWGRSGRRSSQREGFSKQSIRVAPPPRSARQPGGRSSQDDHPYERKEEP